MTGRGDVDVKGHQIDEILHGFFDKVRKNVHAHQKQVSLDFQERLNEPVKEEFPRLFEINVHSFYQGEYFAKQANDYQPLQEFSRETQEGNFHTRNAEKLSKLSEIFHESGGLKQNVLRHVMILGPAGSGKTTTLKRFGRDAVNGEILGMKDRFIHIVKCRSFEKGKEITVQEYLFRYMHSPLSDDESRIGYKWVLENSEKVVLIIDSLDTLGYELDDETESIEPWDHARPSTILYNIFIGQILKKAKILSSSREYKVGKYDQILHPDRIISLGGLSDESVQNLVFGFLKKDDAERAWEILDKRCPDLMALCEIPMFLTFAMVVLAEKDCECSFVPNTGTGIMINLLQNLLHSKHARASGEADNEYVVHAVNKMKELAFNGTMKGKVIFSEEDLKEVELTPNEVTDLAIVVPGSLNKEEQYQQILERDIEAMFAHQIIQEVLTALFIGQKSEKDFSEFISKYLHTPEFSVIRRMLNGVFLDPLVSDTLEQLLEEHCETQSHKVILVKSMAAEIENFEQLSKNGRLELIRAIHEAGTGRKDIVPSVWNSVDLSYMPLMTADLHALASSLLDCSYLKQLILWQCNLTEESLCDFANRLENSSVKIGKLDCARNTKISSRGFKIIGNLVSRHDVKDVGLVGCQITQAEMHAFDDGLGNATIMKIDVAYNDKICSEFVGDIVRRRQVQHLSMGHCGVNDEDMKEFEKGLGNATVLEILDVGANPDLGKDGLAVLGGIIKNGSLQKISLYENDLTLSSVKAFDQAMGLESTLTTVDFGFNNNMEIGCFEAIGNFTRIHEVKNISLAGCLDSKQFQAFEKGLGVSEHLGVLDLSMNHYLKHDGMSTLGEMGQRCALQKLILVEARLNADLLRCLDEGLGTAKLELLEVSYNYGLSSRGRERPGSKGMDALAKIVVNHDIKNLGISGCKLCAEDAINFRKAVGGYKVEKLLNKKRINYFSSSLKVHDNQLEAMSEFLPVVSKNIDMDGWELKQDELDFLKEKALQCSQEINLVLEYGSENTTNTFVITTPGLQESELQGSRNSESQDRVVAFTEVEGVVDPDGGMLQIGNSSITFHPGTFRTRTKIWMRLEIDSAKWPEHYLCITPMLYVKAENRLKIAATVRLSSWCKNNGTKESRESKVDVLHCPDIASKWRVIERLPFNNDLVFQFDCLDFSPVVIGQKEGHLQEDNFVVQGYIFGHKRNLSLSFCLNDKLVKSELISEMQERNAKLLLIFTPITVKYNDKLKTVIKMKGESEIEDQFNQESEISRSFQISEDFFQNIGKKHFNFSIPKNLKKFYSLQFNCDLYKNDVIEEDDQCFEWELSSVTESGNITTYHMHGNINAAVVGLDQTKIHFQGGSPAIAGSEAKQIKSNEGPVLKELPGIEAKISESTPGPSHTELKMDDCLSSEAESVTVQSQSATSSSKMEETKRLASRVAEQCARGEIQADNLYLELESVKIDSKKKK
uniref:uncharacterized protein LOC120327812 isoform X2 n=1 Tax=Styela clava TaxID=7725 RepID=UPI00193AC8C2|nr:uncharacterized protein LOC120327812 isoform X2 [Styela clava]